MRLLIDGQLTRSVKDRTVPYPTAAIDTSDHFIEWEEKGLEVDADEEGIIRSWEKSIQPKSEFGDGMPTKKRRWQNPINGLPPVLRYRFPFNYVS